MSPPRPLDELLDLLDEGIDNALPASGGADESGVAPGDVGLHGLGVTPRQPAGGFGASGEVERFEDLHDLPVRLGQRSPSGGWHVVATTSQPTGETAAVDATGDQLSARRDFCCPSARSSLSAYREYELSALTVRRSSLPATTIVLASTHGRGVHSSRRPRSWRTGCGAWSTVAPRCRPSPIGPRPRPGSSGATSRPGSGGSRGFPAPRWAVEGFQQLAVGHNRRSIGGCGVRPRGGARKKVPSPDGRPARPQSPGEVWITLLLGLYKGPGGPPKGSNEARWRSNSVPTGGQKPRSEAKWGSKRSFRSLSGRGRPQPSMRESCAPNWRTRE